MATVTGRAERRVLRTSLTKIYKEKENMEARAATELVQDKFARLQILDTIAIESITDEEQLVREYEKIESYKDKVCELLTFFQTREQPRSSTNQSRVQQAHGLKLPTLELVKFNGEIRHWNAFFSRFRKIHEAEMENDVKFHYLLQSLEGAALEFVKNFQIVGSNYDKAFKELKNRFAREELLVDVYVRELMGVMISQLQQSTLSLPDLYDKLTAYMYNLEALKVIVDDFSLFLLPIMESCLPNETLKLWESHRHSLSDKSNVTVNSQDVNVFQVRISDLFKFLKREVETETKLKYVKKEIGSAEGNSEVFTASSLAYTSTPTVKAVCIFCHKSHNSQDCIKAREWDLKERYKSIETGKCCRICLKVGHMARVCRAYVKCILCGGKHYPVVCEQLQTQPKLKEKVSKGPRHTQKKDEIDLPHSKRNSQVGDNTSNTLVCNGKDVVLLQTLQVFIVNGNRKLRVRVLLDGGSQQSYILSSVVKQAGVTHIGCRSLIHGLFGGECSSIINHKLYSVVLQSLDGKYSNTFELLNQDKICQSVPKLAQDRIPRLKVANIVFTDTTEGPAEIAVLLGSDSIPLILTENLQHMNNECVAIETLLGWTVFGKCSNLVNEIQHTHSLCSVDNFWSMNSMGIQDSIEAKSRNVQEKEVLEQFKRDIKRDDNGRFQVRLPFKAGSITPGENENQAIQRLMTTKRKLEINGTISQYQKILCDWVKEGIVELAEEPSPHNYFLPHRAVVRENNATTKIRPVFDGSAKGDNLLSLNDCLEKGVNMIEDLPCLIIKWRLKEYAAVADIKAAFLAIGIAKEDRSWLRFLWFNDSGGIVQYQHNRLVFGLVSSPFILKATLGYFLSGAEEYGETASTLANSFYCDNLLISLDSEEELCKLVMESIQLMKQGQFVLREWSFNKHNSHGIANKQLEKISVEKSMGDTIGVLGLQWEKYNDTINIPNEFNINNTAITKRTILSCVQKIFDPIGITDSVTLLPKLIIQELWKENVPWDQEVDEERKKQFINWIKDIKRVNNLSLSRWLGYKSGEEVTIHVFCDASSYAYACCIFIRIVKHEKLTVINLVRAKSKIKPIEKATVPRLELMACVLGVRLYNSARDALPTCPVFYFTDSTVALDWIRDKGKVDVFVKNRVKEINEETSPEQWYHVEGTKNPADLLTRPRSVKYILESKWWLGPEWLNNWQVEPVINLCNADMNVFHNLEYFSDYKKLVRSMAWIMRFGFNCRFRDHKSRKKGDIGREEFCDAENFIFRMLQNSSKMLSKIKNVQMFKDDKGILRLRTRIVLGDFTEDFRTPVILPYDNTVVKLLVKYYHHQFQHAGSATLMTVLRERFWIIHGKKIVKQIVYECVSCRKVRGKHLSAPLAPLPAERINLGRPFEVTGVDCLGPLFLKDNTKVWVVLFTCAVYRAVHLELVDSMSTEKFLMAFRRFCSRKGRCRVIYSDNATNFRGFNNLLSNIDKEKFESSEVPPLEWKFIPPGSPWWGGFYERMVGVLKNTLRKVLGKSRLNYDQLYTVLCSCEATINDRPLTYVYSNVAELEPLTPARFLRDSLANNEMLEIDLIEEDNLIEQSKHINNVRIQVKERFRKEYLGEIINFKKGKKDNLSVGDVVLVELDNKKRLNWPIGMITEILKSADAEKRLAKIKIGTSYFIRPFQRIYPLEVASSEYCQNKPSSSAIEGVGSRVLSDGDLSDEPITTKIGRKVIKPQRLDL